MFFTKQKANVLEMLVLPKTNVKGQIVELHRKDVNNENEKNAYWLFYSSLISRNPERKVYLDR